MTSSMPDLIDEFITALRQDGGGGEPTRGESDSFGGPATA